MPVQCVILQKTKSGRVSGYTRFTCTYPQRTGGQKDWPSPTWPRLSASICWSVTEQDTTATPAQGFCSAAKLHLWPHSLREFRLPCSIKAEMEYLYSRAVFAFNLFPVCVYWKSLTRRQVTQCKATKRSQQFLVGLKQLTEAM